MSYFRFEHGKYENKAKSDKMGRPFYEPCVMCRFVKQGGDIVLRADTSAFKETYMTIRNPGDRDHVTQVNTLKAAFEEFKRQGEKKVEGTPVSEWPMLNVAEAENLRVIGVESVEQLAAMSDTELKHTMTARELREKAKHWLEHAADTGAAASNSAKIEEKNKELEAKVKEQAEEIKALKAKVDELSKATASAK